MKKNLLILSFVIVGVLCSAILFADVIKWIDLTQMQFLGVAIFGIVYAFVFSELIFNKK